MNHATKLTAGAAALAAAGTLAAGTGAQEPPPAPPTITVDLSAREVEVGASGAVLAGPTRMEFRNAEGARSPRFATIVELRPGRTLADLRAHLRRGPNPPSPSLGRIVAGSPGIDGGERGALTVTLRPSRSYVVLDTTGQRASRWPLASFATTAAGNGAEAPEPAATVRMVDYGFRGSSTLPREGVIRFESTGRAPHFAVAVPLKPGTDERALMARIRRNDERGAARSFAGSPRDVQGLVTTGAVNDQEVRFRRPGRYLLVCFMAAGERAKGRHQLGMMRAVTVR